MCNVIVIVTIPDIGHFPIKTVKQILCRYHMKNTNGEHSADATCDILNNKSCNQLNHSSNVSIVLENQN